MRPLAGLLIAALVAVSCGGDDSTAQSGATTDGSPTSVTIAEPGSGPDTGPTTSSTTPVGCLALAEEYVAATKTLFESDAPSDSLVEQTRSRLEDLDVFATAEACGESYRVAVCDGLDELTLSGTLVIYQMLTASCI